MITVVGEIARYAKCVFEPDDVVEVRAIASGNRPRKFWRQARELPYLAPELND